jgi:hypothetical protein
MGTAQQSDARSHGSCDSLVLLPCSPPAALAVVRLRKQRRQSRPKPPTNQAAIRVQSEPSSTVSGCCFVASLLLCAPAARRRPADGRAQPRRPRAPQRPSAAHPSSQGAGPSRHRAAAASSKAVLLLLLRACCLCSPLGRSLLGRRSCLPALQQAKYCLCLIALLRLCFPGRLEATAVRAGS